VPEACRLAHLRGDGRSIRSCTAGAGQGRAIWARSTSSVGAILHNFHRTATPSVLEILLTLGSDNNETAHCHRRPQRELLHVTLRLLRFREGIIPGRA
jgi:hypothetical protein